MYRDFYAFERAPFHSTPDPAFFFRSASHQAAWETLAAELASRHGVLALVGEPGVGKTLLLRTLLTCTPQQACTTLWVCAAPVVFTALVRRLMGDLGLRVTTDEPSDLVHQLQKALQAEAWQGRQVVLILDDAQTLPRETLAQLPCLLTLQDGTPLPLQIVLVGPPALQQTLQHEALQPLAQHLGACITLRPLTPRESRAYIMHRLAQVTRDPASLLTPGALRAIVRQAYGVPSALHRGCTSAFIVGFTAQQKPITAALVRRALAARRTPQQRPMSALGVVSSAALLLLAGCLWLAPWQVWQDAAALVPPPRTLANDSVAMMEARPMIAPVATPEVQGPPSGLAPVHAPPVANHALTTQPAHQATHDQRPVPPVLGRQGARLRGAATQEGRLHVTAVEPTVSRRRPRRPPAASRGISSSRVVSQPDGATVTWPLFEARVSTDDDGGG